MMKQAIFVLLAMLTLAPAALMAQGSESLYNGWSGGFQVGVGGVIPTSSLSDDLKGCVLFATGLTGGYNRLRLKADAAYGQPSFKNENPYAVFDDQGRNKQLNATSSPTLMNLSIQLGYTVWRKGRVSVTPMVGFSWSSLSWDINHIKYEKDDEGIERPLIDDVTGTHEYSSSWIASVDIDIKLHSALADFPIDKQVLYTSSLRISPFVTHAKFSNLNPSVKGCCVGLTVSYAGLLRGIN